MKTESAANVISGLALLFVGVASSANSGDLTLVSASSCFVGTFCVFVGGYQAGQHHALAKNDCGKSGKTDLLDSQP